MSDTVHARVSAVKNLAHGLGTYERAFTTAVASARADLNRAAAEFQAAAAESQRRLNEAERRVEALREELVRCREGCDDLRSQLAKAEVARQELERRWEKNKQAEARFDRAASELLASVRTIQTSTTEAIPSGRKFIQNYAEILTDYLKKQGAA